MIGGIRALPAWLLAASGALSWLWPSTVEAAGCCGSQVAQADRLAPGERWSVTLTEGFASVLGGFDGRAGFRASSANQSEHELRSTLGVAVRLTPSSQLFVSAPLVATWRTAASLSSTALAPADLVLGGRIDPASLADWAFTASLVLPTGPTGVESVDPLGADVTGRGAFGLQLGTAFEHSFDASFLLLTAAATLRGPQRGTDTRAMLDASLGAMAGRVFGSGVGIAAGANLQGQPGTWSGGGRRAASSWYLVRLQAVASVPWRSLVGTVGVFLDPPVPGFGLGEVARAGVTVALRVVGD